MGLTRNAEMGAPCCSGGHGCQGVIRKLSLGVVEVILSGSGCSIVMLWLSLGLVLTHFSRKVCPYRDI